MTEQESRAAFEGAGFVITKTAEAFVPIVFYDVCAFVWFARIIQWEFPAFSVARCFDKLLGLQRIVEERGKIETRTHRFLIVAKKRNNQAIKKVTEADFSHLF